MELRDIEDIYPLSPLQEGILFHAVSSPEADDYFRQGVRSFGDGFDPDLFVRAWQEVLDRHSTLRTAFVWDEGEKPLQVVCRRVELPVEQRDWRGLSISEREERLEAFLADDRRRGFDLAQAPLLRLALFRTGADIWQLVWSFHHLLLDGWSVALVLQRALACYRALKEGRVVPGFPSRPYRDYIAWLQCQDLGRAESYWRRNLAGLTGSTPLPLEPAQSGRPAAPRDDQELALPEELSAVLLSQSRRHQLTLNTLVQGAWALLLARYSGESEVLFGTTVSGRPADLPGFEDMVGLFINTLPVRVEIPEEVPLAEWLSGFQAHQAEIREFEYCPLTRIQGWSEIARGLPLFESLVVFENYRTDSELRAGARYLDGTSYPLSLVVKPGRALVLRLSFDAQRFSCAGVARALGHLAALLADFAASPASRVGDLSVLNEQERTQILAMGNASAESLTPCPKLVLDLVAAQAARTPDAEAVVCAGGRLTYRDLVARSHRLARRLRALGIGPELPVGLFLERSLEAIVGLLAVLEAGGVYVPLDPADPPERLSYLLSDACIPLVLTRPELAARLPGPPVEVALIGVDEDAASEGGTPAAIGPLHLAYAIYTSGSTGRPKGVLVPHGVLAAHCLDMVHCFELAPGDRVLQFASLQFDVALEQILPTLIAGATVVLRDPEVWSAAELQSKIGELGLTVANLPTAYWRQVLEEWAALPASPAARLRLLIIGGDRIVPADLDRFQRLPQAASGLLNAYGPTETVITATVSKLVPERDGAGTVPIGRAVGARKLHVLDRQGRLLPAGIPGELAIGGGYEARGYLGRPELTAERFVPDGFSNLPGGRLYRTGDLVRWRPDGQLEFLGRVDHQVKVRGFRVELGEIEAALRRHPRVPECAVLARDDGAGSIRLVAYYVASPGSALDPAALRDFLRASLPEAFVPALFVRLTELPLTAGGKVDRRALPAPAAPETQQPGKLAPARNERERTLVGIWEAVLRVAPVGVHDNFFELGGDSILSLQIVARLRRAGLRIEPRQVFEHPTVAELAVIAESTGANEPSRCEGPVTGAVPLTPIQHRFFAQELPCPDHFNQTLLLESRAAIAPGLLARAVEHLLVHHDALRLRFTREPHGWRQHNAGPGGPVPCLVADLSALSADEQDRAVEALSARAQASLDLAHGPLLRVVRFDLGAGRPGRLLLTAHHLVVDGVSWRILLDDLEIIGEQLSRGIPVSLPSRTTSFKDWAERLAIHASSEELAEETAHWLALRGGARLPVDFADRKNLRADARQVAVSLSPEETRALLQEVPAAYRTQINDVLLTALALAFGEWTGTGSLLVDVEGHGREDLFPGVDLSRTVGWFTTVFPVLLEVEPGAHLGDALKGVKESLRRIPRRGIGYGLLRYLTGEPLGHRLKTLPQPAVSFNYLGQWALPDGTPFAAGYVGPSSSRLGERLHLLEINAMVAGGRLRVAWTFASEIHRPETVQALAEKVLANLQRLIAHCLSPEAGGATPSDFPLAELSQESLDRVVGADREIEDLYPLSPMQEGMLFHSLYSPETGEYFQQLSGALKGNLDVSAWVAAWRGAIERHSILRSSFVWKGLPRPLQKVHRYAVLPLHEEDWRGMTAAEQQRRLAAYLRGDRARGFDFGSAPLMRLALLRLGDSAWKFVWSAHHSLLDGWSVALLAAEVFAAYEAQVRGKPFSPPPARPYREYVAWLAQRKSTEAESYWRRVLQDFRRPTPVVPAAASAGGRSLADDAKPQEQRLPDSVARELESLARRHRLTLNTVVQGAWALLVSRYSGEEDVVFGVTLAGRPAELDGADVIVGPCINTLPARTRVPEEALLVPWLTALQLRQLELLEQEHTPLAKVQEWSEVPRGTPLFETLIAFENFPVESSLREQGGEGRPLKVVDVHLRERVNYPIAAVAVPREGLLLRLKVDPARVDDLAAARMLDHWRTLLEQLAAEPSSPLAAVSLLSAAERQQMLVEHRAASRPVRECLHELFAAQVQRTPDRVAVICGAESLTYRELHRRSDRLAASLRAHGVRPEARIGVCLEPSLELVVSIIGILQAGGAYVPLDPTYPPERLAFMVEDAGVSVLVGQPDGPAAAHVACVLAAVDQGLAPEEEPEAAAAALPENPAYVIYTSGSTGRPKGVVVTHANVVRLLQATEPWFGFCADDVWSLFHSYAFDFSVWEIWGALLNGGRLIVVPSEVRRSPELFHDLLADAGVTVLNQTPSAFRQLLQTEAGRPEGRLLALRWVIFGGEALAPQCLEPWLDRYGDQQPRLVNMYGITETTVHVTFRELRGTDIRAAQGSVVGTSIPDLEVYVLDRCGRPLPIRVPGELAVGGAGLARGYLGRPELTAERFVPHPFADRPGERLYRSGDLARWLPNGELEYLGRMDHQVKIRGFRVELGEIEAALCGHPAVRECVVVAWGQGEDCRLAVYLTIHRQPAPPVFELRERLLAKLPDYMIPASFTILPSLPLTPNGKLDRRALPAPGTSRPELRKAFVAPRNDLEAVLAETWAEVLKLARVGMDDEFFELGGNSVLAMQLVWRFEEEFRIELPLSVLFETGTVATLADALLARETKPGEIQRIASVLRRIQQMSAVEVGELLAEKRRMHGG